MDDFKPGPHFSSGPDPFKKLLDELLPQIPMLLTKAMNRDKRHKLTLELTNDELFKLSEFMVKEGMGKAQIGEID